MDADVRRVALAVVPRDDLVLIGRRADGNPPWAFPGGKIEAGESAEDAAVRETLEETGLRVRATGIIGSRVHPRTGVLITYVAAVLVDEVNAVTAGDDLNLVRWIGVSEARELMDDIFDAVLNHLRWALMS